MFERVVIHGVGLVGGSLGLALRARGLAGTIVGVGRHRDRLQWAVDHKMIDAMDTDLRRACRDASAVILCTPPDRILETAALLLEPSVLPPAAVVTDVAGVKGSIVQRFATHAEGRRFVGAHPMAGKERSGVEQAEGGLFDGAACVVTPVDSTSPDALKAVVGMWEEVGSRVIQMSPTEHDDLVALISHLPHALSFSFSEVAAGELRQDAIRKLAGGSFKDMTRVSAGPPAMWASLLKMNAGALRPRIESVIRNLGQLAELLDRPVEEIEKFLKRAARSRNDWD